jgi:hypothetical protein
MGPIGCPGTSVKNYHCTLRNIPESTDLIYIVEKPEITQSFNIVFFSPIFMQFILLTFTKEYHHFAAVVKSRQMLLLPRLRLPPAVSVFGALPENNHKFKIQTE